MLATASISNTAIPFEETFNRAKDVSMANNDQLTRNERIRLESLAQAIGSYVSRPRPLDDDLVKTARYFDGFIRSADRDFPVS